MQVKRDLGTWVQIVTGIAVMIGLALVIVELRQVQTLSRAQLSSDAMNQRVNVQMTIAGENLSVAMAKACIDPESLRPDEMRALDAYLFGRYLALYRIGLLTYRDGLYTEQYFERIVPHLIREGILETAYGRAWLQVFLDESPELFANPVAGPILEIGRRTQNEAEPVHCRATFEKRGQAIQAYLEPQVEE